MMMGKKHSMEFLLIYIKMKFSPYWDTMEQVKVH